MTDCVLCQALTRKDLVLYEDDQVAAILHPQGAQPGHVVVLPKQHSPILEQVPDFVVGALFVKANQLSRILFENMEVGGVNLLVQNGVSAGQRQSHVMVHVLPRKENDSLNLLWKTRQLSEEEFSSVELKLKEETKVIGQFEREKPAPIEIKQPEKLEVKEGIVDWRIKWLKRIP